MRRRNFDDEDSSEPFVMKMQSKRGMPSAEDLLSTDPPPFSGFCEKKSNSMLAYFFPCFFPAWKKRYFILCGNYLFRYSSDSGEAPKGVPIPLDSCQIKLISANQFEISTLRKVYVIRTESESNCNTWLRAIRERKAQAIREKMGHVAVSDTTSLANRAGEKLFKDRLKRDVDERDAGQMVMNPLSSMGGTNPSLSSY